MALRVLVCCGLAGMVALAAPEDQPPDPSRERLIRKSRGIQGDDVMDRVLVLMDDVVRRLTADFDTGEGTRQLQRAVLQELDLAISQARQNLRRSTVPSSADRDAQPPGEPSAESVSARRNDSNPAESSAADPGAVEEPFGQDGMLREHRRQWGNLPPRDRQELTQGIHEAAHEKYRAQIDRYYEALADIDHD